MENIFNGNIKDKLDKFSIKKELLTVLSSGKKMVHGCYSTNEPKVPISLPKVMYKSKEYFAEEIAEKMCRGGYKYNLDEFAPYRAYCSEPNEQNLDFRLIIAGSISEKKSRTIVKIIEDQWLANSSRKIKFEKSFQLKGARI